MDFEPVVLKLSGYGNLPKCPGRQPFDSGKFSQVAVFFRTPEQLFQLGVNHESHVVAS